MRFPNYAGKSDVDQALADELTLCGIDVEKMPEFMRTKGEVKTIIVGTLHGWSFKRAWYYWCAEGPGIPVDAAMELHSTHGRDVRVAGHCGCPSPVEWYHGLGVGDYHVDSAIGLKALADTIKSVVEKAQKTYGNQE